MKSYKRRATYAVEKHYGTELRQVSQHSYRQEALEDAQNTVIGHPHRWANVKNLRTNKVIASYWFDDALQFTVNP